MKLNKCWCGKTKTTKDVAIKNYPGLTYGLCPNCGTYRQTSEIDESKIAEQYKNELPARLSPQFQANLQKTVEYFWLRLSMASWDVMAADKPKKLLDVGCSTGTFLAYAKKFGLKFELHGQDTNASALNNLPAGVYKTDIDLLSAKYTDGQFDVVTCHDVIEHVTDPKNYAAELRRICSGILQVTTPNHYRLDISTWDMARPDHYWLFSEMSMKMLFPGAALSDISKQVNYQATMILFKQ